MLRRAARLTCGCLVLLSSLGSALAAKQSPSGWIEDDPLPPAKLNSSERSNKENKADDARSASGPGERTADGVAASALSSTPATPPGKRILQGGIEHSQELPAIPAHLSVGATFDNRVLEQPLPLDHWYWIPEWLTGEWRRETETIVSSYSYQTHQENSQPRLINAVEVAQFGVQRDRYGGVWHCRLATSGLADCGSYYSVALIQSQEPLVVSPAKVVIRDRFIQLQVNKETRAIISATQSESITTHSPLAAGRLSTTVSVKFFDEEGMPKRSQVNKSEEMRTSSFAPLARYKGLDLQTAFKKFLLSNGKDDFLPE